MVPILILKKHKFWGGLVSDIRFGKNELKELMRQILLGNTESFQENSVLHRVQSMCRQVSLYQRTDLSFDSIYLR